jgi:hypothetical protein
MNLIIHYPTLTSDGLAIANWVRHDGRQTWSMSDGRHYLGLTLVLPGRDASRRVRLTSYFQVRLALSLAQAVLINQSFIRDGNDCRNRSLWLCGCVTVMLWWRKTWPSTTAILTNNGWFGHARPRRKHSVGFPTRIWSNNALQRRMSEYANHCALSPWFGDVLWYPCK